ncbi:T-cell differentiation antigen CD6 Precursor [Channa argus]|uniref:T-cell differentiation antigen CD6 n=1 Tax=Channa argus TaxID=215402 RepID=A0A6G1QX23_CHAAH|nr:T-cell differentiation antigen CD6 Precursor [Channa argus]KAK2920818.1 hypothetical protein Q8A73_000303 [Channa argus]
MKLNKYILIVQLSCLCKAFQNTSTPTATTDLQVNTEGNNTTKQIQEEINSDPFVQPINSRCNWTLRMPENRSSVYVPLTADAADLLAVQICQELDCGVVFAVNRTSSPANSTCFHDCFYANGRLQNCSESKGNNCTIIEVFCGNNVVQLAEGNSRCDGRVELWRDGRWGTVCDDQWSLRDADVVCDQLKCGYALNVTGQGGSFPPGRGPIYRDELNCTGKEKNLWDCPAARDESDCGHKEDAGVVCSEMRAIRLTGGLDRCSGILEVHRNGSWGTVCDNCWNKELASMVCSMLQCGDEPQNYTQFNPPLKHNNGTRYYYSCDRRHQNLWQCFEYTMPHLCIDSKASGVICKGSRGFPAISTENVTGVTASTAPPTTITTAGVFFTPSPTLLSTIVLSLLLLVFLITNTVLCCLYRRRHAFLLQQSRASPRQLTSERHQNNNDGDVDLVKVTTNPVQTDAPNPRYIWTQLSSVDSTSVDTDYEQHDPSNDPSTPLSTFRNSQRYRTDVNPLMRPSGLDSLCEEGPEPTIEAGGTFTNYNGGPTDPQYTRVSKISVDSFDTSSTSSGECYENINGCVTAPEPGQLFGNNGAFDPSRLVDGHQHQFYTEQATNPVSSDEDDDHIYSPVSPD